MKKIPTLFQRDPNNRKLVLPEVTPGCEWVLNGEGFATVKWDGTAVLIDRGHVFKRYELKPHKEAPAGFLPAQDLDPITGEQPGWVPMDANDPADRWLNEAVQVTGYMTLPVPWTYELIGPKINGNPHQQDRHMLIAHGMNRVHDLDRSYEGLKTWFELGIYDCEGLVFWRTPYPDCDKVKIKRRDLGLPWPL